MPIVFAMDVEYFFNGNPFTIRTVNYSDYKSFTLLNEYDESSHKALSNRISFKEYEQHKADNNIIAIEIFKESAFMLGYILYIFLR